MPKFVFLWTDLVLWLVVLGAAVYGTRVRGNRHLRARTRCSRACGRNPLR